MNLLLTGSNGFVGKHIIRQLKNDNEIKIMEYDIKDNKDILKINNDKNIANKDIDIIVHLAANISVRDSELDPLSTYKTNILGTFEVAKFAVRKKVKKFIFASSAAVYGNKKNTITINDNTNPINTYGKSKLAGEFIVKDLQKYGINTYILRYFNIYGPPITLENGHGVIFKFVLAALNKERIIQYGNTTRDFVYVEDVASINRKIIKDEIDTPGIYNISTGKGITINEIIQTIKDEIKKYEGLENIKLEKKEMREEDIIYSVGKSNLEYEYTDLKEGIKKTISKINSLLKEK